MAKPPVSTAPKPSRRSRAKPPAELANVIATTAGGRDITRPYATELEEARDPRLAGSVDWGVYDKILMDDQVKSCLEQRIRAVVSRDWDVLPGDSDDDRSVEASDRFKEMIEAIGWDRVTEKMLYAPYYGIAAAEVNWGPWNGMLGFVPGPRVRPIHVRHARRFRYDKEGRLRLLTTTNPRGEILPERKFWVVRTGATNDDEPYGLGLAAWLYWPVTFKRNGMRFWNKFLDKFSVPTAVGKYRAGTLAEDVQKLLGAIDAIANDTGVAIPDSMAIELLQIAQAGVEFADMPRYMDEAIAKVILSQTMTTDNGSSRSQAEVHSGVKLEVVKADADLLSDSFNAGPARWWTDLNYGADVASPRLVRILDEEEDAEKNAKTDEVLGRQGWIRTDESFRDKFGDGYERTGKPPPAGEPAAPAEPDAAAVADDDLPAMDRQVVPFRRQRDTASYAEGESVSARDVVNDAVDQIMADEGWREIAPVDVPTLVASLSEADSPEAVETILAQLAGEPTDAALTDSLARAGFAVRIAAITGDDVG